MHGAVSTFQPPTRSSTVPAWSPFTTRQIDFCCHFLKFLRLGHRPPPPPSRSQTRGAGGERRRAVICYGHLHCPVTRHVPLLPVHSQSRLHFGKLDSDGESKLVSRQWRRSGSQTGGSCWRESRGYAEPGEVRTNPATVRAESGSTAGVISAKAVRAMQLSTGPPGKRSPETKTMSSFHQQFLFVKRRMVNALWL